MGKSEQQELRGDRMLKIHTGKTDASDADDSRFAYEPTPYHVLDRIANRGYVEKHNTFLDFGCGKGRAVFYFAHVAKCHAIGLEYNARILEMARENRATALSGRKTEFVQADAAVYVIPQEVDRCFFFNPFSVDIFRRVYANILESWYGAPREILLFFYYISDEYLDFIYSYTDLRLREEIDCGDYRLGERNRERILVFALDEM